MAEFVKKGLAYASIPTDQDNFVIKLLMRNLNDKSLSRVILEYFTKLTFFMSILARAANSNSNSKNSAILAELELEK